MEGLDKVQVGSKFLQDVYALHLSVDPLKHDMLCIMLASYTGILHAPGILCVSLTLHSSVAFPHPFALARSFQKTVLASDSACCLSAGLDPILHN